MHMHKRCHGDAIQVNEKKRDIWAVFCVGSSDVCVCVCEWGYPEIHMNMSVCGGRMCENVRTCARTCVCVLFMHLFKKARQTFPS